jgi:hypothetical protein
VVDSETSGLTVTQAGILSRCSRKSNSMRLGGNRAQDGIRITLYIGKYLFLFLVVVVSPEIPPLGVVFLKIILRIYAHTGTVHAECLIVANDSLKITFGPTISPDPWP